MRLVAPYTTGIYVFKFNVRECDHSGKKFVEQYISLQEHECLASTAHTV